MTKNRALLLDRDGVINVDNAYVGSAERFVFMHGLFPFLRAVRDRGYRLAILTNQAGVARGYFGPADYDSVTTHMLTGLKHEGIEIDLTLACFEHPEGKIAPYTRESFWRKPHPGMVLQAIRQLNLNPAHSAFLGDSLRDMHAGLAGGIGHNLWLTDKPVEPVDGVKIVRNYDEALRALLG